MAPFILALLLLSASQHQYLAGCSEPLSKINIADVSQVFCTHVQPLTKEYVFISGPQPTSVKNFTKKLGVLAK